MLESPTHHKAEIQRAGELLKQSHYAVALTGAGISTPSGIPDFRSAASGLWEKHDPTVVANISAFRRKPQDFYDWIRPLVKITNDAQPNPAHTALAELEKIGPLQAVVTQNIDGLHTAAGSDKVYEVHGHVREVECLNCGRVEDAAPYLAKLAADGVIPTCAACDKVIKPKVILFGELLPLDVMNAAQVATRKADVMIVAGSSLEVAPVSELPWLAHQNNARLIIVNFQPTPVDHLADIIIRDDVAKVLPAIVSYFKSIA
ncbi:MAG: NAD-dependent deacylase [Chloroflexota bacterium]